MKQGSPSAPVSLLLFLVSGVLSAAEAVGGRVEDSSGASVQAAKVEAVHKGTGARFEVYTGSDGHYRFESLGAGVWILNATRAGFEPVERVIKLPGQPETHFRLEPAAISQSVLVRNQIISLAEQAREIPGSVNLLDSSTLTQSRVFNLEEALRKVPGVNVRAEEGFGLRPNIGIRGMDPTRSAKVLLLEDGTPLTLAPYGASEVYYHPPVEKFDSIEVIKGAGQILYGPQTTGGVINYLTPQPPQDPAGQLTLVGGNRDYLNARLMYGATVRNTGFLIDVMRKQGEGSRENLRHGVEDFSVKVVQPIGGRQMLSLKTNYWIEDSQVTYSGLRLSEWLVNPRANPFHNDSFNVNRFGASAAHALTISPKTILRTNVYGYTIERNFWRQSNHSGERPADAIDPKCGGMANLDTTCGNEGRLRHFTVAGIDPRLRTQQNWFGVRNEMDLGFRVHHEIQERIQENGDTPRSRNGGLIVENNQRRNQAFAGFLQNRFVLGRFALTPGMRVEHVRYQRWNRLLNVRGATTLNAVIPGIGATYSPSTGMTLFAGVHRGFAPTRTEDLINNVNGGVVDLDPELSWNYEAGMRGRFGSRTSVEAAYFRTNFENQIIPATVAGGAGAVATSGGPTVHEGFELAGDTHWRNLAGSRHSLHLRAAYTWLGRAEFASRRFSTVPGFQTWPVTGNRLPYAPKSLMNLTTTYTHASGLNAMIEGVHTGSQFADDLNTVQQTEDGQRGLLPSRIIWNASVNYPIERWRTTVFITSKNLFDRLYVADRVRGMLPGAPRLAQVGLLWAF